MHQNAFDPLFSEVANGNIAAKAISTPATEKNLISKSQVAAKVSVLETILMRREQARAWQSGLKLRLFNLGVNEEDYIAAIDRSRSSGANVIEELIAYNIINPEDYYRAVAKDIDLNFVGTIDPALVLREMNSQPMEQGHACQLFTRGKSGLTILHIAPDRAGEKAISDLLERDPKQKSRIYICTPKVIAMAQEAKKSQTSLSWATTDLHQRYPQLSAKQVFAPWQAFVLGTVCAVLPICFYVSFVDTSLLIHVFASLLFSLVVTIRLQALRSLKNRPAKARQNLEGCLPKYSALVALHKEAEVAGQLIRAMAKLDWPASRLEVLYVCEEDDNATIEALYAYGFPPHHRILKVPKSEPRTKPKALNYALRSATGEYIVIYDAEDRPHPMQLKEAAAKFCEADERLACLQAPLQVTNGAMTWLSRMFAFEYAAHFQGLLPFLAQGNLPLPLGGTSNHFRKSALESVGGWDPYNVTEDADLGIRFSRFGYRCDVLLLPTLEDGPETFKEWYPQRTRWKKGWMQTFLVHNRNVSQLFQRIGTRSALYFEIILMGFVFSPLLFIPSILMAAYSLYTFSSSHLPLIVMDMGLLLMGYFCSIAMGLECIKTEKWQTKWLIALTLPFYWLLQSGAAWRAAYQLLVKPHYWEKTPHRPVENETRFLD